jgi:signal transduction histidine kinase
MRLKAQSAQKRILFLHTTTSGVSSEDTIDSTFQRVFHDGAEENLDEYTEYVDLVRFPDPAYQSAFVDFLRRKYRGGQFDLIVTAGAPALDVADRFGMELFPDVPVVFQTEARDGRQLRSNFTGVFDIFDFESSIKIALQLQPDIESVFVVSGTSVADRYYLDRAREQLRSLEPPVKVEYLTVSTVDDLLPAVSRLPPRSIIYLISLAREEGLTGFQAGRTIRRISDVANAPIYCWIRRCMDYGVVGGSLRNVDLLAEEAAKIALRVLRGERPEDIPIRKMNPNVVMLDWRQLKRWRIDARPPDGSHTFLTKASFWNQYKWRVFVIATLLTVEAVLIAIFLIERSKRKRAAAVLGESDKELQKLSASLISLQDEERRRIARQLHDSTAQNLFAISMNLERLGDLRTAMSLQEQVAIEESRTLCEQSLKEVRTLTYLLHPPLIDQKGLVATLRGYLDGFSRRSGIVVSLDVQRDFGRLPDQVEMDLFRIVQEALSNILRHSGSPSAAVCLERRMDCIVLQVVDWGRGMSMAAPNEPSPDVYSSPGGVGIPGMRHRLRQLGGRLDINSTPEGTTITAIVPISREGSLD